jgi:23S rRNA (adenine1618-N6)-methyltransferase
MNSDNKKNTPSVKKGLHPRNNHRFSYDFKQLIKSCAELAPYVLKNRYGNESVDFADPAAVRMLNRALLKHFYGVLFWDIPENYLCPPIPGRADYIHNIADLLSSCNGGIIPQGKLISVLDIGVGANCIYPIIGTYEYGWHFTGTDIDPVSITSAKKIVNSNSSLAGLIDLRLQKKPSDIFRGIIKSDEIFDVTICNPPFHSSPENAHAATLRKRSNLNSKNITGTILNFGGQNSELWTHGGEESFVRRMIDESSRIPEKCLWFTTLISKKTTMAGVYKTLKRVKTLEVKTINMAQGQKISRVVAWTFLNKNQQKKWISERWNRPSDLTCSKSSSSRQDNGYRLQNQEGK